MRKINIKKLKPDYFYKSQDRERIPIKEGYIAFYKGKKFMGFRKITKKEEIINWLCSIPVIKGLFVTEW